MSVFASRKKNIRYQKTLVEKKLDTIIPLVIDLDENEFKSLMEAIKGVYGSIKTLRGIKTLEEKECADIDEIGKEIEFIKTKAVK